MFSSLQLFDFGQALCLSLTIHVMGIKLSMPSFPHLYNEDKTSLYLIKLWGLNEKMTTQCLSVSGT